MLQANPRLVHSVSGSGASAPTVESTSTSRSRETALLFSQLAGADEAGRTEILERVVLLNTGLALAVSRRYHRRGIDGEDLDQTAYRTLVLAARTFDGRAHQVRPVRQLVIAGGFMRRPVGGIAWAD